MTKTLVLHILAGGVGLLSGYLALFIAALPVVAVTGTRGHGGGSALIAAHPAEARS